MKKIGLLSSVLLLGGGLAFAQQPADPGKQTPSTPGQQVDPAKPGDQSGTGMTGTHDKGMMGTHDKSTTSKTKKESKFTAEVVSVDTAANTITVKRTAAASTGASGTAGTSGTTGTAGVSGTAGATASGAEETLNVDTKAQSQLKKVSAGDRVKLMARTDDMGKEVVTKIDKVDIRPASGEKP